MGSVLDTPWRHVLGVWLDARGRESPHSVPWLLELDLGRRSMLWTSHRATQLRYRGVSLLDREAALVCAATELGRFGALELSALVQRIEASDTKQLRWAGVSDAVGLDPWSAGEWPLRRVLGALEATPVRVEVLVAEQRARAA